MPNKPNPRPDRRKDSITDIIKSIAKEQEALADILNAESEKINKAIDIVNNRPRCGNNANKIKELLSVNESAESMIRAITQLEIVLQNKLALFNDCLCDDNTRSCGKFFLVSEETCEE